MRKDLENMSRILLAIFDICIPQCTFPPDCCRLSVRTRPHSLARTLHFQAVAISSPLLSSLVPSASLFYSYCLPLPNRPPFLSSCSFSLLLSVASFLMIVRHPHIQNVTYLHIYTYKHIFLLLPPPCSPHFPSRIQRFMRFISEETS